MVITVGSKFFQTKQLELMDTVRSSYCFKSSSCSASAVAVHLCCCASRKRERMRKRTISHIFVCCFHLVANSEKKSLGLYFNKVIINKWKETLETLEVVLILISSCLDGNELGLEVRLSLGRALNINGGRGRGWCLLCHTLCFYSALFQDVHRSEFYNCLSIQEKGTWSW